jgi:hypothetical protein
MSNVSPSKLLDHWLVPDRTNDRVPVKVRLPYIEYARLQAFKEVYPGRSVNDMLLDVIRWGLDELVESLPKFKVTTPEEIGRFSDMYGISPEEAEGITYGPAVDFDNAFRKIMKAKGEEGADLIPEAEGQQGGVA